MYALEVQNISKVYRLYTKPVDRLKEIVTRRPRHKSFFALKDISFSIPFGKTLGVIGDNGAGKSTLLKILAGTLSPTSGEIIKRGRVAALLELGAGFHPEFTGRQNIYLNAALLGLSREEISVREEDIIDFAELRQFIDQPVKTYSTGMYVRLAFSIATTVDPDILIIDEALSVGDQHFQKKCIDRMMAFRNSKTIIFCSHSMYLINELCSQAIWLTDGVIQSYGMTSDVVGAYLNYLDSREGKIDTKTERYELSPQEAAALPEVIIQDIRVFDSNGNMLDRIEQFHEVVIQIKTKRHGPSLEGHLGIGIVRPDGQLIFGTTTKESGLDPILFEGEQITEFIIPSLTILHGIYQIKAVVADRFTLKYFSEFVSEYINIFCKRPEMGVFWIEHKWRILNSKNADSSD
nr:ABC transporter ATP-binding protein [Deltaproteobacteria bacterium]